MHGHTAPSRFMGMLATRRPGVPIRTARRKWVSDRAEHVRYATSSRPAGPVCKFTYMYSQQRAVHEGDHVHVHSP